MFYPLFFFFNDTATTEIYTVMNTLSLHDALPICLRRGRRTEVRVRSAIAQRRRPRQDRSEEHTSELQSLITTSYAVFCLKKKKTVIGRPDVMWGELPVLIVEVRAGAQMTDDAVFNVFF